MERPITSVEEDSLTFYCPTCGKPNDQISSADDEIFKTYYCLNCVKALGVGIFLSLKVVCPECCMFVVMG
jgi:DNA-directed RNA polymerase subunit RPC12/RpoP